MTRYQFAISNTNVVRETGVVNSESFTDALTTVSKHVSAEAGDMLEIGVVGFPPARFRCIGSTLNGSPSWRPLGQLAA